MDTLERRLNMVQKLRNSIARESDPERKERLGYFEKLMLGLAKDSMEEQEPSGPMM